MRLSTHLGIALLSLSVLVSANPAQAQDYWDGLSNDDLLKESRAAFHLGFLDAEAVHPNFDIPSSLDLTYRLLDRSDLTGDDLIDTYRIQFQVFDRRGLDDIWEQSYDALPDSLPGVSDYDWERQKLLWSVLHWGARYEWGKVHRELRGLNKNFNGHSKADHVLIQCRSDIRNSSGAQQPYFDLATEIANAASWDIDDPYFDPYFGLEDFSQVDNWDLIEPLLQILGEGDTAQNIGLRRWFEFAAPSMLNPLGSLFPDAPASAQAALRQQYRDKSELFAPDPNDPVPTTGGYREILGYSTRFENYALAGDALTIIIALRNSPEAIEGIPAQLWNEGYKISWRTLGDAGILSLSNLRDGLPEIEAAAELMPPAPTTALMHGASGLVRLSMSDSTGVIDFAKAMLITVPHPLLLDQLLKGLCTGQDNPPLDDVLNILAQEPYMPSTKPQVLVARGLFGMKQGKKLNDEAIIEQAVRDAATGLDLLERWQEPTQVSIRDLVAGPLVESIRILDGDQKAQNAQNQFAFKPIRRNSAFNKYLDNIGGPSNTVDPIFAISTEFETFVSVAGTDSAGDIASGLGEEDLVVCASSVPRRFSKKVQMHAAHALFNESKKRSYDGAQFGGTWDLVRLKQAELDLLHPHDDKKAIETLHDLNDNATDPYVRDQANLMLNALSSMDSFDSYIWAQDQMSFFEDQWHGKITNFQKLLAEPLADAALTPMVQDFLNDPQLSHHIRVNHLFNIARAQMILHREEAALSTLEQIMHTADATGSYEGVSRPIAELWWIEIWWGRAKRQVDHTERDLILDMIITYVQDRYAELDSTADLRRSLVKYGIHAARMRGDQDALGEFTQWYNSAPIEASLYE